MNQPVMKDKKAKASAEPTLISTLESGQHILDNLIAKYHHELATLKIVLLCTNKEIKQGGHKRPGKVQKTTPLVRYFTSERGDDGADIVITVSLPVWNDADDATRHAIIDHLLAHVVVEEDEATADPKVKIVGPAVAEFAEIAERHGAYTEELRDMRNVLAKTPETVAPVTRVTFSVE